MKSYITRIYQIAKGEGIEIEKHAIVELVKRKFPDLRNMLNVIQGFYSQGKTSITVDDIKKFNSVYKDIYDLVFESTDPVKNYQYLVSEYSNRVDDVLASLGNEMVEYMKTEQPEYLPKLPQIVICVAKYQSMRNQVIDPIITMLSCVFELQTIIHSS